MGEHPEIAAKKLVLQTVFHKRTCPPEDLLLHWQDDPKMHRHVQSCLFCRERLEMLQEHPELSEVVSALAGSYLRGGGTCGDTHRQNSEPAPGQIWSLKPHLGGWGPDAAHFNPPLVLIVSLLSDPIQAVRVAQIFHEPDLAGPGDVELSPEQGLAEAWNVYTLAAADLDSCRESIDPELLATVQSQARLIHPDPEQHSVLQAFRELELKTGCIMASHSLFSALTAEQDIETMPSAIIDLLSGKDPESLRARLQSAYPELILPSERNLSGPTLLGLADWDNLPLAAADSDKEFIITCVWLDSEHEVHLSQGRAVTTVVDRSEHGLFVAGHITEADVQPLAVSAWWVEDSEAYAADQVELSPDGMYFQLRFSQPGSADPNSGKLKILLAGQGGL
ncbi:MAG: hypothetical protein R6V55_04985 [Desulfovermiculus sp.]